jgi:hypothetical protein
MSISLKGFIDSDACHELISKVRDNLEKMSPGFSLLTDLTLVTGMPSETYQLHIETMETVREHGVAKVARVFGDERKDVGLRLASNFHYEGIPVNHFPTVTKALEWLFG